MKKWIAMLLAMALCLTCFALAETPEAAKEKFSSEIEDGAFIIRVDAQGDLAWMADDMAQDPSVVRLDSAENVEDDFVARYVPVGDGDMTVAVRHFSGIACDEIMTWDLRVADGAVQEVIGGSYAASIEDAQLDDALVGSWLEQDTQFAAMTIEKNPTRGWDIEIVSPVSHGAYVFKTSVLLDCELNSLVYDKGKFWDIDGNYDPASELGEARTAGTTGSFAIAGEGDGLTLEWHDDDENAQGSILFVRGEAEADGDEAYVDPRGDLAFFYDPAAFEVSEDAVDGDIHAVVLTGTQADWGDYSVTFSMRPLAEGEEAPRLGAYGDDLEAGAEATQGEWNGFEDVIMYSNATDSAFEQVFVVPVKGAADGAVQGVLTIGATAQKLEDEEAAMDRDDAISGVLNSLTVLGR